MTDRRDVLHLLALAAAAGPLSVVRQALAADIVAPGLKKLRGHVAINGRPAQEGQIVMPGDTVATGPDSEAVYVIGQDAFLQRDASVMRFGADVTTDFLRVISGRILSVFGRVDIRDTKRLGVATATIGIRGTGCYIEEEGHRTYFCLCYGEAEVTPTAAPVQKEIIRTRHHDHPIYINADPAMSTSMVPAGVINHTDAELTLLEALVGRVPPFQGQPGYSY